MSELADRLRAEADAQDNEYDVSDPDLLREAADAIDNLAAGERQVLRVIEEAVAESYYIDCDPGDRSKIARGMYDELIGAGFIIVGKTLD